MPINGVRVPPRIADLIDEAFKNPGHPIPVTNLTAADRRALYRFQNETGMMHVTSGMIIEASAEVRSPLRKKKFRRVSIFLLNFHIWFSILSIAIVLMLNSPDSAYLVTL